MVLEYGQIFVQKSQIGTYNFVDPTVSIRVIEELNAYCDRHGFQSVKELTGALKV